MTDAGIITNSSDPPSHTDSIITSLTISTSTTENSTAPIGIKLDGSNYALCDNVIVKGWLINSMDSTLIGNVIRFPTAKLKFYIELQGLWREIEFRCPNPMECATDIYHHNNLLQEDRVYTFLDGLDDRLDNIRSDQAYAHVRREALQQVVMSTSDPENTLGVVLTTKRLKLSSTNTNSIAVSSHGKSTTAFKSRTVPDGMKCSHCGNQCHTTGADKNKGKVAIMSAEPHLSLIPQAESSQDAGPVSDIGNYGSNLVTSSYDVDRGAWLLNSGAKYHMTFAATDFTMTSPLRRTSVANANGVVSPIIGAGSVYLSHSLQLSNMLLVPSLSHKLLSISQDILTKEIIGHGTKRRGLYYMEDVSIDEVLHVFQSFHAMIQTQFSSKLRVLRFDNGGEYVNQCFRTYFKTPWTCS
ncbi:hypothetical protein AAG906_018102 [Vitis piasezkii]